MIDDVRFIRDTYDHWYQGSDNTGDIMKVEYIMGLQEEVKTKLGGGDDGVMLVTADGSIDCLVSWLSPRHRHRNGLY
jgi:hypothetical protein